MTMQMDYRRWTIVSALAVGLAVASIGYLSGAVVSAAIFLLIQGLVVGLLLWWTRPREDLPQLSHAAAQAAAGADDVIIYWMPG